MVKNILIICGLLTIFGTSQAQERRSVEVGTWMNYRLAAVHSGFDPGSNGAGIGVGLQTSLKNNFQTRFSGELGAAGVGFYVAGTAGIGKILPVYSSGLIYTPGVNLVQGAGLFRPGMLYMWGAEQTNVLSYRLKNGSLPGLMLSVRYYGYPGYSDYSAVNHFLDLRIGVNYSF